MNLAASAKRNGVGRVTAYRCLRAGLLPAPAHTVGRLILVEDPSVAAGPRSRAAVHARLSSADQKVDLDRQAARLAAWAAAEQIPIDNVVTEFGSASNGRCRKLLAQSRELVVVDAGEADDDLMRDMTEILSSLLARRHGKRTAANRASPAVDAAAAAAADGEVE
jgi:predicted site-specific integrase-resolvase